MLYEVITIWFVENCWPGLHQQFPNLKFYVAGRNAPAWLINKFHYPNIEFVGEVEDAYRFMNSKSIMIVPLFSGSGMRIKIIEGMALGKTIVSTEIGAEGIEVSDNENILIATDADVITSYSIHYTKLYDGVHLWTDRRGKDPWHYGEVRLYQCLPGIKLWASLRWVRWAGRDAV